MFRPECLSQWHKFAQTLQHMNNFLDTRLKKTEKLLINQWFFSRILYFTSYFSYWPLNLQKCLMESHLKSPWCLFFDPNLTSMQSSAACIKRVSRRKFNVWIQINGSLISVRFWHKYLSAIYTIKRMGLGSILLFNA